MDENAGTPDLPALTAEVVSAYVTNNSLRPADISDLIASVHRALQGLSAPPEAKPEKREPPVPIKKSVTPDFLISLEDGRRYKSLKRHLAGRGLTPQAYREKWGLSPDYPMVAPNYAKQRSELARASGLGQLRRNAASAPGGDEARAPDPERGDAKGQSGEPQKRRGRARQKAEA